LAVPGLAFGNALEFLSSKPSNIQATVYATAMSRLTADGWFRTPTKSGRNSFYRPWCKSGRKLG